MGRNSLLQGFQRHSLRIFGGRYNPYVHLHSFLPRSLRFDGTQADGKGIVRNALVIAIEWHGQHFFPMLAQTWNLGGDHHRAIHHGERASPFAFTGGRVYHLVSVTDEGAAPHVLRFAVSDAVPHGIPLFQDGARYEHGHLARNFFSTAPQGVLVRQELRHRIDTGSQAMVFEACGGLQKVGQFFFHGMEHLNIGGSTFSVGDFVGVAFAQHGAADLPSTALKYIPVGIPFGGLNLVEIFRWRPRQG